MSNTSVLIIDDELQIRKLLRITLESNNYDVTEAEDAKSGILYASNHPPDLIILDLGLPDEDGHSVLIKLRDWYTKPVIILSVQSDENNIIKALDNGANDYLTKPFRPGELLARIRSVLRNNTLENNSVVRFGDLEIDFTLRIVKKDSTYLKLTVTEYKLLALFAESEGKVLTHSFLLKTIWGPGFQEQAQYLRVFIAQLRKKIETDSNKPKHIITESGVGYRFLSEK